jgi:hypothetical protein
MKSKLNQVKAELASLKLDHIFKSNDIKIENTNLNNEN